MDSAGTRTTDKMRHGLAENGVHIEPNALDDAAPTALLLYGVLC